MLSSFCEVRVWILYCRMNFYNGKVAYVCGGETCWDKRALMGFAVEELQPHFSFIELKVS